MVGVCDGEVVAAAAVVEGLVAAAQAPGHHHLCLT